jgi:hypothetical protein
MASIQRKPLNVAALQAKFDGMANDVLETAQKAGELILETALPMTPEKSGALRESGRVEVEPGKTIKVHVIFGNDESIDYAAIIHEDLENKKNFTTPGTGPKYLENAVDQCAAEVQDMFAKDFESMLVKRFR